MNKVLLVIISLSLISCKEIRDYLRKPDTGILVETLNSARLTGYAATVAMLAINQNSFENAKVLRSNQGFPCSALIEINLEDYEDSPALGVEIAGIWADENTAVLSLIFTNYDYGSNTFELLGIETIPVIREDNNIRIAVASQEISLNPDEDALLSIDLDNVQFESELVRLDMQPTEDIYVAVSQNAYFIDVNIAGTMTRTTDDAYTICGGGQFIEVENNSAEIIQQAFVDVYLSPACPLNPQSGMALLRTTGVEEDGFPELGTAVFEFNDNCQGKAEVFLATGIYVGINGQKIPFLL